MEEIKWVQNRLGTLVNAYLGSRMVAVGYESGLGLQVICGVQQKHCENRVEAEHWIYETMQPEAFAGNDFGWALQQLRAGRKIRLADWHPGDFVVHQKGYPNGIPINKNTAEATGMPEGTVLKFLPYLMQYDFGKGSFAPWLPGMIDILTTNWELKSSE